MDLYFAGSEQPIYLRQLDELGVKHIAVSFFEWQRRHSSDDLYKHIPSDISVCVTAGIARKADIDFKSFGRDYVEFCEANAEQSLIYDMDSEHCPLSVRQSVRRQLSILPNTVMFPIDDEDPAELATKYERIGINASLGKSIPLNEMRRLPATLYGSNITDPKKLREGRFAATTSTAWMGGFKFGELWVFSNNRLSHYKAESLQRAVRAHRAVIEALGVDPAQVAANDHTALTEVAVKSLQQMAASLSKRPRDRENVGASSNGAPKNEKDGALSAPIIPIRSMGADALNQRPTTPLPIISINEQEDGQKVISGVGPIRTCDSCDLSEHCPKYEAESTCAFSIPVEIKTREQWEAASQVLLETQYKRTLFGAFAEQVDGGGLTPRVGQEMDRWFGMLKAIKELEHTEPDSGSGGIMGRFMQGAPPLGAGSEEDSDEEDDYIEGEIVGDEEGQS